MMITNKGEDATLHHLILEQIAKSASIDFCVSFVVPSGISLLIEKMKEAIQKKAVFRIITSTYLNVTHPAALTTLLRLQLEYPDLIWVRIYDVRNSRSNRPFHSKGYLFIHDRSNASGSVIVGSSNLSRNGLKAGIEWSLFLEQDAINHIAHQEFDDLWISDELTPLTPEFLADYQTYYLQYHSNRLDFEQKQRASFPNWDLSTNPTAEPDQEGGETITQVLEQIVPTTVQKEALNELAVLHDNCVPKAAVIAATGLGKTYLASFDILNSQAHSVLFIAHRTDLLAQASKSFQRIIPAIEDHFDILAEGRSSSHHPYVFATIQSLSRSDRYLSYPPTFFDYIIIDEFHHAAATSYQTILDYFRPQFLLGLTATPERPDGKDVIELCDNTIAYRMDLHEAINKEYLIPFHYFGVADDSEVDYTDFPWRRLKTNLSLLEGILLKRRVGYIIEKLDEYGFDGVKRKCIGFCISIKHAEFMAREFQKSYGKKGAVALTSNDSSPYRQQILSRLENLHDPLKFVFAVDVLNEGIDIPSLNTVLFLRPTTSSIVFLQQLGRGLRLHPERFYLTVLDFVANDRVLEVTLDALNDPSKNGNVFFSDDILPPDGCEVMLEERTRNLLTHLRERKTSKKQAILKQLGEIAQELDRLPQIMDLLSFKSAPRLWKIRSQFSSFSNALRHLEKSNPTYFHTFLETEDTPELAKSSLSFSPEVEKFLALFEQNWQEKRIGAYAFLWGLLHTHSPDDAEAFFFTQFPEWECERNSYDRVKLYDRLERKLTLKIKGSSVGFFVANDRNFTVDAWKMFQDPQSGRQLLDAVTQSLLYFCKYYFRERYQGVLRHPSELLYGHVYSRPEIMNHYLVQYDPQRHEKGILSFTLPSIRVPSSDESRSKVAISGSNSTIHHVLLVTLKKAQKHRTRTHAYADKFLDLSHFQWQSQNGWTPTESRSQNLILHAKKEQLVHLFVQRQSGAPYYYLGKLLYLSHIGEKPITFQWLLKTPLSQSLFEKLTH